MIEALLNSFEDDITGCVEDTNSDLIEVYDCYHCTAAQQRSYIKIDENDPVHFTLKNPGLENLTFAAMDNCMLRAHEQSRCDFLLGNFRKLYFVEIKQINRGQRRQARTNAIQQLESSVDLLSKKLNFSETELIAVICLKAKQVHPLQNATRSAKAVAFKENYNAALMEGQVHTF
jgi:hypothetical protein